MIQDNISSTLYTDVFPALLVPTALFLGRPYESPNVSPLPIVLNLLHNFIDGHVA
jgi:hypothetical protein